MNFLSHLFLASDNSEFRTGALMGDFLRGVDRSALPEQVEQGVIHHLSVDSFTDSHEEFRRLKRLFSEKRRRFSPIMIDVVFDHFLLKNWDHFSNSTPEEFVESVHRSLLKNHHIMPARMKHVVSLLIKHEVLLSYRSIEGVGTALDRIADRFHNGSHFYGAVEELYRCESELEEGFLTFFPQLYDRFKR